ncbi:MAG: VWA domain-containing protein [Bacteroidota bacterium]
MKKIVFIAAIIFFFFSCTKDESDILTDKSGGDRYTLSEGSSSSGSGASSGSGGGNGTDTQIEPGQITAAEWNDLENWDFWTDLINGQDYSRMPEYWSFDLSERISVLLKEKSGEPAVNILVELINDAEDVIWSTKTDNRGSAELWAAMTNPFQENQDLDLRIKNRVYEDIRYFEDGINEISLEENISPFEKTAQIAFMVDATGSMSDELEYLKVELVDVIGEVRLANPNTSISTGSVFYRDQGDEYVTRVSAFTPEDDNTIRFIKNQYAEGGGDFPEAVHTALDKSLNQLQWSSEAGTRILFLLLDAPPHYENQIISQIHHLVKDAAARGIKLIPITASGIDKETEFLMRYLSIASNGSYVFITDHSGIGGEHLEASVGQYEVEFLNELMVRLINKYI